jgi:hypothetical protein
VQSSALAVTLRLHPPIGFAIEPDRVAFARLPDDAPGSLLGSQVYFDDYVPGCALELPPGRYVVVACAVREPRQVPPPEPDVDTFQVCYFSEPVVAATETRVEPGSLVFAGRLDLDLPMSLMSGPADAVQSHYEALVAPSHMHQQPFAYTRIQRGARLGSLVRDAAAQEEFREQADDWFSVSEWRERVRMSNSTADPAGTAGGGRDASRR